MTAAVKHLLRQMQRDGRLAYLIGPGSQSYELLTQEGAAAAGQDVKEFRKVYESTLTYQAWPNEIESDIGAAIENASSDLPDGYVIHIEIETYSAVAHLQIPNQDAVRHFDGDLDEQINAAVQAAEALHTKGGAL